MVRKFTYAILKIYRNDFILIFTVYFGTAKEHQRFLNPMNSIVRDFLDNNVLLVVVDTPKLSILHLQQIIYKLKFSIRNYSTLLHIGNHVYAKLAAKHNSNDTPSNGCHG